MKSFESFKGVIYAVISSSTFGLIPLFAVPPVLAGMPVNSVVFYRFFFSAIAIGLVLVLKKIDFRISRREFAMLCVLGILYASTSLILTSSYFYIPSGTATTIHFLYPVVVSLIMALMFKEQSSMLLYGAVVLAIGGVYMLSGVQQGAEVNVIGYLMAFSTVLTYAGYLVVVNRSCINRMNGLKATFWVLTMGMVIFFFNTMIQDGYISGFPDTKSFIQVLMLALLSTLVSDLTLILAIQRIGSTITAILGCMEPLTAVCMGAIFLGEKCSLTQGVGILIILCAVILVIYSSKKKKANC